MDSNPRSPEAPEGRVLPSTSPLQPFQRAGREKSGSQRTLPGGRWIRTLGPPLRDSTFSRPTPENRRTKKPAR